MTEATAQMGTIIDDLGVGLMPDASPTLRFVDSECFYMFNANKYMSRLFQNT